MFKQNIEVTSKYTKYRGRLQGLGQYIELLNM